MGACFSEESKNTEAKTTVNPDTAMSIFQCNSVFIKHKDEKSYLHDKKVSSTKQNEMNKILSGQQTAT